MFSVGDVVTIKIPGRYDTCTCDFCRALLTGGYGIIEEIDEREDNNHACRIHIFNMDGAMAYSNSYYYRFNGMTLFHNNETPDWEI